MKARKAFIKPFWGATKKCESKYLHEVHFGKKSRNNQNEEGEVLIKERARDPKN